MGSSRIRNAIAATVLGAASVLGTAATPSDVEAQGYDPRYDQRRPDYGRPPGYRPGGRPPGYRPPGGRPPGYRPVVVRPAPPPPRYYRRPPMPYRGAIWSDGYWGWRGNQYVWTNGQWMQGRRGARWIQPHWVNRGGQWMFVQGHWR